MPLTNPDGYFPADKSCPIPIEDVVGHEIGHAHRPIDFAMQDNWNEGPISAAAPEAQIGVTRASHLQATGVAQEGPFPSTAFRLTSPLLGPAGVALQFSLEPEGWKAALASPDGRSQDLTSLKESSELSNQWQMDDGRTVCLNARYFNQGGPSILFRSADQASSAGLDFGQDGAAVGSHLAHRGPQGFYENVNHWEPGSGGTSGYRLDGYLGPHGVVTAALADLLP